MKTEYIDITYQLVFESPFHFGTGMRSGLINRSMAKDAEGFLYIPGSTLKGALRERCEQLAHQFHHKAISPHTPDLFELESTTNLVGSIFGTRFNPGTIYFDDARMIDEDKQIFETDKGVSVPKHTETMLRSWQTFERTQAGISRLTGTAKQGHLYTTEYGLQKLHFKGQIYGVLTGIPLGGFYAGGINRGTYPLLLLLAGLLSLSQLGGNKSTGAGKIRCEILNDEICIEKNALPIKTLLAELPALDYEFFELVAEE